MSYQKLFHKNIENCLYPFFWQHGEEHAVLSEYVDKIYESGMHALCVEARPHPNFVQEQWWSDMDLILSKCKEKGMKMWILDDSHFPTGYANGRIAKDYPQYLKTYIHVRRFDVQGPFAHARIDLKMLKGRPFGPEGNQKFNVLGVYMAKRTSQETIAGDPIDPDSLQDITNQMRMSDRLMSLDIPEGAYSVFVVFETDKGGENATKDYLNPLIKEATEVLLEEVYEPHYDHYKEEFGKTIEGFFSDEPRFGNAKGPYCPIGMDMPLPWRSDLESELPFDRKYMPLLWHVANGKEAEIRLEYMDIITKLYNENFTKVLADWCEARGVFYLGHTIEDNGAHARLGYGTGHYFRGQEAMHFAGIDVIGGQVVPGQNYHHDAFQTGGSNGEFFHYALAKLGTSAAHLDAKKAGRCMCESFGAYGWNEGIRTMKWIADHLMVRGVNYIVPHAFDPKSYPDWDCPPHFYAHGNNPQFRYFNTLDSYMNRTMNFFRGGYQPSSIGVFYPAESEWMGKYMPVEKVCRQLTINQISFDIVSRDYLQKASFEEGHCSINGVKMDTFIFPYAQRIPSDMVSILFSMIEAGIRIIFINEPPNPAGEHEKNKWNAVLDRAYIADLYQLKEMCSDHRNILGAQDEDLVLGEYVKDGKYIYMFFNESLGKTIETEVRFKQDGKVYCYDALTDTMCKTNTLKLHPYEAKIFVVCDEDIDCIESTELPKQEVELPAAWSVKFADSFGYPNFEKTVPTHELGLIHTIEGYDDKAGTVQYKAILSLKKTKTVLDLGKVHETAQVFVNGQLAGTRICLPYTFDLTDWIQEGDNEITIEVTNTLGTEQRDYFGHFLLLEPFGIEGPVSLKQSQ